MKYKQTVAEAWAFTQGNKGLTVWFGAIPAFFTTAYGIGYLIYQYFAFQSSVLFEDWERSFAGLLLDYGWNFFGQNNGLIVPAIILTLIFLAGYFLLPSFCNGALIQIVARKRNGQKVRLRHGMSYGLMYFLPLFEYSLLIRTFSIWSFLGLAAIAMRTMGWGVVGFFVFFGVVGIILALLVAVLFTYTEYFIVIDDEGVFASIRKSVDLVVRKLEQTIFLTLLMVIIAARIVIQMLFVFLIPALAFGLVYLFTIVSAPEIAYLIAGIVAFLGLIVSSYLTGIVHVFAVSVWTFTFLQLTEEGDLAARDSAGKVDESEGNAVKGAREK